MGVGTLYSWPTQLIITIMQITKRNYRRLLSVELEMKVPCLSHEAPETSSGVAPLFFRDIFQVKNARKGFSSSFRHHLL